MWDKKKQVANTEAHLQKKRKAPERQTQYTRCYQKHCSGDSRRQEQGTVLGTNRALAEPVQPQLLHLMVCWRLKSFGIWRCVKWQIITDVWKDRSAKYTELDRLTQMTKRRYLSVNMSYRPGRLESSDWHVFLYSLSAWPEWTKNIILKQ